MTDDGVKWYVFGVKDVLIVFEARSGREMRVWTRVFHSRARPHSMGETPLFVLCVGKPF